MAQNNRRGKTMSNITSLSEYQVYSDKGYGVTSESIEYLETLKGKLGSIRQINIDQNREMSMEIVCEGGLVLLSGCNCGYGGTGPHGSVKVLELLGFNNPKRYEEQIFGEESVRIEVREEVRY